eukprot:Gb_17744 [translate_table: standard]
MLAKEFSQTKNKEKLNSDNHTNDYTGTQEFSTRETLSGNKLQDILKIESLGHCPYNHGHSQELTGNTLGPRPNYQSFRALQLITRLTSLGRLCVLAPRSSLKLSPAPLSCTGCTAQYSHSLPSRLAIFSGLRVACQFGSLSVLLTLLPLYSTSRYSYSFPSTDKCFGSQRLSGLPMDWVGEP